MRHLTPLVIVFTMIFSSLSAQDDCATAISQGTLNCEASISVNGLPGMTSDAEASGLCIDGMPGTWHTFNFGSDVTEFDLAGTDYILY